VTQDEAVTSLEEVARRLGISARMLDGSVWAFQAKPKRGST
jgi:hypothetical protein